MQAGKRPNRERAGPNVGRVGTTLSVRHRPIARGIASWFPRAFPISANWNYREPCELLGARYPAAPLGLITAAALLPPDWTIRLLDLNTRAMDPALLDWADLVMAGGMILYAANTP